MSLEPATRWGLAALFWTVALAILAFNLARQRWNWQGTEGGAHVSGIPFLASLGIWIGAAASPLDLGWIWLLAVVVELPAVGDFVTEDDTAANESQRTASVATCPTRRQDPVEPGPATPSRANPRRALYGTAASRRAPLAVLWFHAALFAPSFLGNGRVVSRKGPWACVSRDL